MHIVHISPEIAPAAKTGGLGDVVQGLGWELSIRGHRTEVIVPKYDCMRYHQIEGLVRDYNDLYVPFHDSWIHCSVDTGVVGGVRCFFIDAHSQELFFNRGVIYGHEDDAARFAFFCQAALEYLHKTGRSPDIIHCHDWQTGLAPVLLAEIYKWKGMLHPRTCFTLHNIKHQGLTHSGTLRQVGLDPVPYITEERLGDTWHPGVVNLLKAGIVYSNAVTTVSPTYMREIRETHLGHGMQPTLAVHAGKLRGILNGVDYNLWNPETDPYIASHYTAQSVDNKTICKAALRRQVGLRPSERPLVCVVSRLDDQKGVHLVRHAITYSLENRCQFVLLGTAPDPVIAADFDALAEELAPNPDVHLELRFDGELAHRIYAGADMILIPSMFEPCGLTQLIGMKYGTVPVVRRTGGLTDTVFDADYGPGPAEDGNGYTFDQTDEQAVESALRRAFSTFVSDPRRWRQIQKRGMLTDHSWNEPGRQYVELYEHIKA